VEDRRNTFLEGYQEKNHVTAFEIREAMHGRRSSCSWNIVTYSRCIYLIY
jgi:hypothetical protein